MDLVLKRIWLNDRCTQGVMQIDSWAGPFTLEDKVREVPGQPVEMWKVEGATAIPAGQYEVTIDMSVRFQRQMPHILNVDGFDGIRIHSGNTDADTSGCILLGEKRLDDFTIADSKPAFDIFFMELRDAIARGEKVTLEIVNPATTVVTDLDLQM